MELRRLYLKFQVWGTTSGSLHRGWNLKNHEEVRKDVDLRLMIKVEEVMPVMVFSPLEIALNELQREPLAMASTEFVLDLKWIKWDTTGNKQETTEAELTTTSRMLGRQS